MTQEFPREAIQRALIAVTRERRLQHQKWGTQRLSWPEWASVLLEEVGEAAREGNQLYWSSPVTPDAEAYLKAKALEKEVTHAAAVAVAWLEHIQEALAAGPIPDLGEGEDEDETELP
jgi:hypothetical protein